MLRSFLYISFAYALDMTWTKYSDAADLPLSQKWRDDMRDKLRQVDVDALPPDRKEQYKKLWARLTPRDQDVDDDSGSFNYIPLIAVGCCIAAFIYMNNRGPQGQAVGGPAPGATVFRSFAVPTSEDVRNARLRRFEVKEGQTDERPPEQ
eukprot:GEMP01032672.1.p1 GENE.GEMP01032672.1~~GEMP01032672.1.p1  ORF type:complete len:163 (-),score=25.50 GEMP01032672.1:1651-2100(-)